MTAGTAIANGTAIPAVSRMRNSTSAMKNWSSMPMRRSGRKVAQSPDMHRDGAQHREAKRRRADRHDEARNPQRRLEIGRRALAETPGRLLEPNVVPQQQRREAERQQVKQDRRQCAPAF